MRARNLSELCGLLSARRDVARAELRLRQPRATATANPILATKAGERALKARQIWNDPVPLQELLQTSESVPALPGPPPLLAINDKPGPFAQPCEDSSSGKYSEDSSSGEDSEDETNLDTRTVFAWGGTFAVYHSKRPGNQELLNALKREAEDCLLYTSPSPRDATLSRMPSSA